MENIIWEFELKMKNSPNNIDNMLNSDEKKTLSTLIYPAKWWIGTKSLKIFEVKSIKVMEIDFSVINLNAPLKLNDSVMFVIHGILAYGFYQFYICSWNSIHSE